MTMQRRHFELIAETIREGCGDATSAEFQFQRDRWARIFARKLAATNPQFNRSRFLKACGVED